MTSVASNEKEQTSSKSKRRTTQDDKSKHRTTQVHLGVIITFDQVKKWVEDNVRVEGRFRFYQSFAKTKVFYHKVARPLLSMRTVGPLMLSADGLSSCVNIPM